jgi:hypothetical protein
MVEYGIDDPACGFRIFRGKRATFSSPADSPLAMFSKPWFTKQIELAGP